MRTTKRKTDDGEQNVTTTSIFDRPETEPVAKTELYKRSIEHSVVSPLRVLLSDWRGKTGIGLVILFVVLGVIGPLLIGPPRSDLANQLVPPFQTLEYPLGTDYSGRGLLKLTVYGTTPVLKMVTSGAVFATMLGAAIGMIGGYKQGVVDDILMILTDVLMTLPGLPLVIVISFILTPENPYIVGLILAVNAWTGLARAVRSQVLTLRNMEYVEAARFMGVPTHRILLKDLTPQLMPYVLVNFMNSARGIIFSAVALYFLGILPYSRPNWGVVMNNAYNQGALYSVSQVHWILIPMIALTLFSLGLILLAQAGDRVFNPRIRTRHMDD